jgi:hypothetical protein
MSNPDQVHYVCRLAPGLGRELNDAGYGREVGNGWFEVTQRVEQAAEDDWLPMTVDGLHVSVEVLHDLGRRMLAPFRAGDVARTSRRIVPAYWVYDGVTWHRVDQVQPRPPRWLRRFRQAPDIVIGAPAAADVEPDQGEQAEDTCPTCGQQVHP